MRILVANENAGGNAAYSEIIGQTPAMTELKNQIEQASNTSEAVLITGERGTGKELAARMIHYDSPRSKGPFVTVNIAALSKWRFELAHGGTLLLDEISDLSQHQQE